MHFFISKTCGESHKYMQNPGLMDRNNVLRNAQRLTKDDSITRSINEHSYPDNESLLDNDSLKMSSEVIQLDFDNDELLSDNEVGEKTVVRSISMVRSSKNVRGRKLTSTTEQNMYRELTRHRCNAFEDIDIDSVSTNSSSSENNDDSNDNNNILSITDGEYGNTDSVDNVEINSIRESSEGGELPVVVAARNQQLQLKERSSQTFAHQDDIMLTKEQIALTDLFLMLEKSGAPLNLFDRIIDWSQQNINLLKTYQVDKRSCFLKKLKATVFPKSVCGSTYLLEPCVSSVQLPSGKTTTLTTHHFEDYILEMISPENPLFCEDNLLINPENPKEFIVSESDAEYFGDVHTGQWMKRAQAHVNALGSKHVLMPFCLFIDEITIDKYGKLKIEACLCCCLWFKRECRKKASFWFNIGYIEKYLGKYKKINDDSVGKLKQMDWHHMMSQILSPGTFMGILGIQQQGGMHVDLTIGFNTHKDMILHPEIAFIICDCEGRDMFVGRHKGHSKLMPGLCGDCNCKTTDASNINISCSMRRKEDHVRKTKEDLRKESFHKINNAFFPLNFGHSPYHIFGSCPPEVLHLFELGFSEFVFEIINDVIPPSILEEIHEYAKCVAYLGRHQSQTNIPNLSAFSKGLTKVHLLKAREKHARLFLLYVCFLNSHCVKRMLKGRKHVPGLKRRTLKKIFNTLEQSLIMHSWLNSEKILRSHVVSTESNGSPLALDAIKRYMKTVQSLASLTGFNLDRPKFHQILHFVHYIKEFGVPPNFDGSRCECFGKEYFKHSAVHTNGSKPSFNHDTSTRLYERKIVDVASKLHLKMTGVPISKYASLQPNVSLSSSQSMSQSNISSRIGGTRFTLIFETNIRQQSQNSIREDNLSLRWKNSSNNGKRFPLSTMLMIQQKLFLNDEPYGGRVHRDSVVHGFTEYTDENKNIYRAHPEYRNTGEWFDWAFITWTSTKEDGTSSTCEVPAQLLMFVDLSSCTITGFDEEESSNNDGEDCAFDLEEHNLWAVVQSAKKYPSMDNGFSNSSPPFNSHYFMNPSVFSQRFIVDNDYYLVPLESICKPAYVITEYERVFDDFACPETLKKTIPTLNAVLIKEWNIWANAFVERDNNNNNNNNRS